MFAFLTNKVPFFSYILKYFAFLTQIRKKYGIFAIPAKNKVICDTESIYMSILADEACRFTSFFSILRHNDVITVLYWKYDFRFEIRVSKLVYLVNFNS